MEQSPSWEANRFSASQVIPPNLWKPKVHYRNHKFPLPAPILSLHLVVYSQSWKYVRCFLEQAVKAQKGSRVIALLSLTSALDESRRSRPIPNRFTHERDPVAVVQEGALSRKGVRHHYIPLYPGKRKGVIVQEDDCNHEIDWRINLTQRKVKATTAYSRTKGKATLRMFWLCR